jgi:hypothetical protein
MTTMRANPPWANRILNENWKSILAEVGKPAWMPKLAEGSGKKKTFAELGCGHYGCVFATDEHGIVFKISTDPSEVEFVKAAMKLGDWPTGIVRYHAVLDVQGSHRKRQAFVVWREEAFDVGKIGVGPNPGAQRDFQRYHDAYRNAAMYVRELSIKPGFDRKLAEARKNESWAWNHVIWEDGLHSSHEDQWQGARRIVGVPPRFKRYSTYQRLAAALRICAITFELMEHTNYAPDVGAALGFYLDHGILLADVHMNNIGRVRRDEGYGVEVRIVITDPGHAVFLGGAA